MIDGVVGTTWTLQAAALDVSFVGASLVVTGSAFNNGTWTVASLLTPQTFTTVATPTNESFSTSVIASFQPVGTISALTDTLQPGALWIELRMAIAILDKSGEDSSALQVRLQNETKRIVDAMRYKQDEPKQVPLAGGRRGGLGGWRGGWV